MKPTLEEYVKNLKAELKKEIAKREESEYRHAVVCEALENLLEGNGYGNQNYELRQAARLALNGVPDEN